MKHKITFLSIAFNILLFAQERNINMTEKMQWFQDAKLGVFIHWGIYSVNGIPESWAFFNNYINYDNYMKQLNGFTAYNYNPNEWIRLIKKSGAKYSVITTRHHDGVSLWDSKAEKAITTIKNAAAKKDLLAPFIAGLKNAGLKTGLYYSLLDWSHPYYNINTSNKKRYEIKQNPALWQDFIKYYQTQLNELSSQFKPDLMWFDGGWEHSSTEWQASQTLSNLRKYNPNIIINSRLNYQADYETPEQGIPVIAPHDNYWELCYTMNDSWGYQSFDKNYKTPNMIIRTLVDVISMGGNLLIDIGPKADGTIPTEQVNILKNLGRWTKKYSDAVYATRQGLPFANYKGKSALSKDKRKLFLYLEEAKDFIKIYGLNIIPETVQIIGDNNAKIIYNKEQNGNLMLNLSNTQFDKDVTVVQLNFNKPITYTDQITDIAPTFQNILEAPNSKLAIYEIANQLHKGINLLKNSGITSDGMNMKIKTSSNTNPEVLNWISKNAEALYDTGAGLPNGHYAGMSALSKDKKMLYLFVEGIPTGPLALKGLKNNISRIYIAGEGSIISHQIFNKLYLNDIPGIIYIDVPKEKLDKNLTTVAILLDKPIELYREKINAIEKGL
ncbi:TPA: alpha-L-fucosidase [Elizabethkingia anophelis]